MRLTDLKRPRYAVPLVLLVVLAVACGVVFHPAFQKKMLLEHVGPLVDSLEIGSVHLTPWSLDFDRVRVGYRGGKFQAAHGALRFCLLDLLRRNLDVESLVLHGAQADLREFKAAETQSPPAPPAGPFPGILGSLDQGFSYTLLHADVNLEVQLPGQRSLAATLTGLGIRPEALGMLTLTARFNTGKPNDHLGLTSRMFLTQQRHGRFPALEAFLHFKAALAALPRAEQADLTLNAQAAGGAAGGQAGHRAERWLLTLRQDDNSGKQRSALELHGDYDGNDGQFAGSYRLTANERLVQPYAGTTRIPSAEEALSGALDFNLADLTGSMTFVSDLLVSGLRKTEGGAQLPEYLRLKNNFRVALLPDLQLRVETIDSGMTDDRRRTNLTTKLPADLHVPLQNISGFMRQENTLLEFDLPEIPLTWCNAFLPGNPITGGNLTGAFTVTNDPSSALHIKPRTPLRITALGIRQADGTGYRDLDVSAMPAVTYAGNTLHIALDKVAITAGTRQLGGAGARVTLPLDKNHKGSISAQLDADLNVRNFADFLAGRPRHDRNLPRHLELSATARLRQRHGTIEVSQLDAGVTKDHRTRLLALQLKQPLRLADTQDGRQLRNDKGTLAALTVSDIRLGWFSGFLPGTTLQGNLHRARLELRADGPGRFRLAASAPLRLDHVTVSGKQGPLLEQVGVSLRPELRVADGTTIGYRDLDIRAQEQPLLSGNGRITLPGRKGQPLRAAGRLTAELQGLSQQPVIAGLLQAAVTEPVRLESDYRLALYANHVDIDRLSASLRYQDSEPRLSLQADSGIRVRTRLGRRQSELGRARGRITLTAHNLDAVPFAKILAARGLSFHSANGKLQLSSDGRAMTLDTVEPLEITGVSLHSGTATLLQPFTLHVDSGMQVEGDRLHAQLKPFSVTFDRDKGAHTLDGTVDLVLTGNGDRVRAGPIDADLKVRLPALLDQPVLLPGHTLTRGELDTVVKLDADGRLSASARVHDLQARQALPLQELVWQADGHIDPDGSFAIKAPLTTQGKSGNSSLHIAATHSMHAADNDEVTVNIDSPMFYLNDVLNTLRAIGGKQAATGAAAQRKRGAQQENVATAADATQPDTRAFWDHTGYSTRIRFNMDKLYYTDYLAIQDIHAHAELSHGRLALRDFTARFHASPLSADGTLDFIPGATPYDLRLNAGVNQFDLARFFRELDPRAQPRAEGLFDVSLVAFGKSPNMAQYRNNLYFDAHLHSRKGLFRLLDPNSPLVQGSTGLAGGIGEVVSYVPTSLFGLGTVSRLVNYIKVIPYDKIDIHLTRDASRNVQIREYVVQSPEILFTASGGIQYQPGKDVLHSPLAMDARLGVRDKGAAILYDMDLLKSGKDAWGYSQGPDIQFRGTPANPVSNLDDIISRAAQGMILGAITRPISGLIGNIRYRWFGNRKPPVEYRPGESPQAAPPAAPAAPQ